MISKQNQSEISKTVYFLSDIFVLQQLQSNLFVVDRTKSTIALYCTHKIVRVYLAHCILMFIMNSDPYTMLIRSFMTLLLTITPEPALQDIFEQQRQRYYPKKHNRVPAHIIFFHQLPELHLETIMNYCQAIARETSVIPVTVTGLMSLGRGVAFELRFDKTIFFQLKNQFEPWLIPQDQQTFKPHVTIQNKVNPEQAKTLLTSLQSTFTPFSGMLVSLSLWYYREGLWEHHQDFIFQTIRM